MGWTESGGIGEKQYDYGDIIKAKLTEFTDELYVSYEHQVSYM